MMKKIKNLCALFVAALLCACGGGVKLSDPTVLIEQFQAGEKALIVTRSTFNSEHWLGGESQYNAFNVWVKIDDMSAQSPVRYSFYKNRFFLGSDSQNFRLYMIDPGVYMLESTAASNGSYHYSSPDAGPKKKAKSSEAFFEVKAGEVIYIGDLDLRVRSASSKHKGMVVMETKLSDHFDEAKKVIAQDNPEIAEKMEKRLARFARLDGQKKRELQATLNHLNNKSKTDKASSDK